MENKSLEHHISLRLNNLQYRRLKYLLFIENKTLSELMRTMLEEYRPKFDLK